MLWDQEDIHNGDHVFYAIEMWIAMKGYNRCESIELQDVKRPICSWELGSFTFSSRMGNQWNGQDFVRLTSNQKTIEPFHITLFDILKQYQNEVNDIRAERIAKSANPLALLAAAQPYSDNYYQAPKPQRSNATSSSTRPTQRDKDMQKNLALLAKYFKRLYKPTNNNLRTSSNSRNKTKDTTPRYNNDNQSGQFGNQRTMTVAGTRETVGSPVVQQTGIQCFNCKGFGHYAKECRKPKRVKDYTYHKEKMMMLHKLTKVFHYKLSKLVG
ncbi:hypothetical protein Tco_0984780 [Tanacetum coccineum]